jgi:hypothetical protein
MINEIKIAMRGLLKTPAFTAIALVTVALAIGANTAVFSLISGLLIKPLPYSDPAKLVLLWEKFAAQGLERIPVSAPEFFDLGSARRRDCVARNNCAGRMLVAGATRHSRRSNRSAPLRMNYPRSTSPRAKAGSRFCRRACFTNSFEYRWRWAV